MLPGTGGSLPALNGSGRSAISRNAAKAIGIIGAPTQPLAANSSCRSTPATVVGGYLRMLQKDADPPLGERQQKMVDEAAKSNARIVALVASTPTRPVRVTATAGFTAGTNPTIGTLCPARKCSNPAAEAALQATTIAFQGGTDGWKDPQSDRAPNPYIGVKRVQEGLRSGWRAYRKTAHLSPDGCSGSADGCSGGVDGCSGGGFRGRRGRTGGEKSNLTIVFGCKVRAV